MARAAAVLGWLALAVGLFGAGLGYLMARDVVLVEGATTWMLGPYQWIGRAFYLLTGLYVAHDVLELLVGAAAFALAAFGAGLLLGLASAR
ncbi:MAG TPA: hypothetical protein VG370_04535 [Chloroflexota bacterium]|nr:hypothetical protein [Chloroflexota bacterium]